MTADRTELPGLSRSERMTLLALATVQFVHLVDFMILMPLGPRYSEAMKLSPFEFGMAISVYGFAAAIAGLAVARVIDRFDRRTLFLWSFGLFTVATLFCGLARNYGELLAARALAGAFGGVVSSMVLTIVGDLFPLARRGRAMGIVMTSFSVALIAGVPAGLYLADVGDIGTPFLVLGLAAAGAMLLCWKMLPSMRGHFHEGDGPRPSLGSALARPEYLRAYALMVALVLSTFTIVPYIATYMVYNLGRRPEEVKYVYLAGGAATFFAMSWFGRLSDRHGKLRVFRILACCSIALVLILTNLPPAPLWGVIAVTTCFMVATSGRMVPAQALIASCAPPAERGLFMSVLNSVQQVAVGFASLLGGYLLGQAEDKAPLEHYPLVGLIAASGGVLSVWLIHRLRVGEPHLGRAPAGRIPVAVET